MKVGKKLLIILCLCPSGECLLFIILVANGRKSLDMNFEMKSTAIGANCKISSDCLSDISIYLLGLGGVSEGMSRKLVNLSDACWNVLSDKGACCYVLLLDIFDISLCSCCSSCHLVYLTISSLIVVVVYYLISLSIHLKIFPLSLLFLM